MHVNVDDIRSKIDDKTKALFIIHYYGFPQNITEIKKLCDEKGLYLLEDCAHAFLSKIGNDYLGTFGAFGILSMQKFLPLPNGGVLLINNNKLMDTFELYPPNKRSVARSLVLSLLKNTEIKHNHIYQVINLSLIKPAKKILSIIRIKSNIGIVNPTSVDFNLDMVNLSMSKISKRILSNIDLDNIIFKRKSFIFSTFKKIKLFFVYLFKYFIGIFIFLFSLYQ